jgi:hypothetical protein
MTSSPANRGHCIPFLQSLEQSNSLLERSKDLASQIGYVSHLKLYDTLFEHHNLNTRFHLDV